ncbi:MAG: SelB C-terminal domain-containing protein [Spirochaetes bacterium]|nr:SelB C-terminal domain-containing protein [Spirochaetota bacterium]
MKGKKIDKIFNNFYENNPLRFGMRKREIEKHFSVDFYNFFNIMKEYNDKYDYNGVVFYKKNREIYLNESLEKLKNEILKYFVEINKLDLDYFETSFKINKKAILNIIDFLIDTKQLIELISGRYYLKSQIYKKYLNIVINELMSGPKETSYLKDKLNISREKAVIFLEYLDNQSITKFQNNKRVLIKAINEIV